MTPDSMIGLTSAVVSIIALILSVWFYFAQINRSLEKLLDKRLPTLDEDQALDLLELYLAAVQSDMQRSGRDFVETVFPKCIEAQNDAEAYNKVFGITDTAIQHHRAGLKRFYIVGGQNFEQFLYSVSPLDSGLLSETKHEVLKLFRDAIDNNALVPTLYSNLVRIMEAANRRIKTHIRNQLQERYQTIKS